MTTSGLEVCGRSMHQGEAYAELLVLDEPLSFWGGVDQNGTVIDRHHPQVGVSLTGKVVAMPSGRGSSSSTAVLAELIRSRRGPAAILLAERDTILVVGALVAAEMYETLLPIVELGPGDYSRLVDGSTVAVHAGRAPMEASVTVVTA